MHTPWLFASLSTIITFALLLVLVRWIGSTQLTQLTFFNWVAGASMGNIAANMISTTTTSVWLMNAYTLILFTLCSILAAYIAIKNRKFRLIANGEPVVLIHKGSILRDNMRSSKVNVDVLLMMLREKGYFEYSEIEYAILEPTGNLSILPAQETQSATKKDLAYGPDMSDEGQGPYISLIIDGELDVDKLKQQGKDEAWLKEQLDKLDVQSVKDVTYMGINSQGEITADVHRRISSSSKLKL